MKRFFQNVNTEAQKENIYMLSSGQYFLSGAAGGFASGLVACPVEHIRIRMQVQTGPESTWKYKSVMDCAKKVAKGHGFTGVNRGMTPTLLRDSWGYGLYFAVYEILKNKRYPI